jgi:hypothetical protein
MTDIATDSNDSPDTVRAELPEWFKVLVCLGSAVVGGLFGAVYMFVGMFFGALGGVFVAVFWLKRISEFQTQSVAAAILGGIGWGIVAGLIDTAWLHATSLIMMYSEVFGRGSFVGLEIILVFAVGCGVVAGAIYGLLCMIVLEIYRACKRRGQE